MQQIPQLLVWPVGISPRLLDVQEQKLTISLPGANGLQTEAIADSYMQPYS